MRERCPSRSAHRLGMKMGCGSGAAWFRATMGPADAWRPDLGRWQPTPWERSARTVFRDHRMSRPAPSGQHVGQPLSFVPRCRARHPCGRRGWKRSSNAPPGSTCTRARWPLVSSSARPDGDHRGRSAASVPCAGIKLAGVMSDVFGVSGMLMLRALAEGTAAPAEMAGLAKRRLRRKVDRLALALDGCLAKHQRLLLRMHIRRLEEIGRDLAEVEAAIEAAMQPFAGQRALLATIPGVDALTAAAIIADIGVDMTAFGSAQRLAAWVGVCPANHESAGKQKRRGTRKGNTHLKAMLVTAAVSASQAKGTYLRDKFHRLRARMGTKKAAMAVAHKILIAVFHILQGGVAFADLGGDYLDRVDKHRTAKRLVRRLSTLGYDVLLRAKATG